MSLSKAKKKKRAYAGIPFQNFTLLVDDRDRRAYLAALSLYEACDTPESLGCYLRLKYGDWLGIAQVKTDPRNYLKSDLFDRSNIATSFLSKYPYLPTGVDRESVAYNKFLDAEEQCRETNSRFRNWIEDPLKVDPEITLALWLAARKISILLKDFDWEEFLHATGWGPGSTNVNSGSYTSGYNKYSGALSATSNCLPLGLCCVNSTPSWAAYHAGEILDEWQPPLPVSVLKEQVLIVKGGKIVFVPKNAETDRTIIVPVSLNSYVQRGPGKMMRRRLKRAGVDLDSQELNQRKAYLGSVTEDYATLDAKAASDCVAFVPVITLFPEQWVTPLLYGREAYGHLKQKDRWIRFQKFSAMGNSYTFELESVLFYALCSAGVEVSRRSGSGLNPFTGLKYPDDVTVYGDDMIVPTDCVPVIKKVLNFAGFSLNDRKTFVSGNFRESCGADYFRGTSVRPIFLKERISSEQSIYKLANNIRRLAHRRVNHDGCDSRFRSCWLLVRNFHPNLNHIFRISEGYGDGGFISNLDEATPPRASHGWEGFVMRCLAHTPVKENMIQYRAAMAVYLSSSPELPREGKYDLRSRTKQKTTKTVVPQWYNLGPWVE